MTPIGLFVREFVIAMLDGPFDLKVLTGQRNLVIEVHVASSQAKGVLIGAQGETISALRHLVHRIGKRATPPLTTWVEVIAPEERG